MDSYALQEMGGKVLDWSEQGLMQMQTLWLARWAQVQYGSSPSVEVLDFACRAPCSSFQQGRGLVSAGLLQQAQVWQGR